MAKASKLRANILYLSCVKLHGNFHIFKKEKACFCPLLCLPSRRQIFRLKHTINMILMNFALPFYTASHDSGVSIYRVHLSANHHHYLSLIIILLSNTILLLASLTLTSYCFQNEFCLVKLHSVS